MLHIMEGTETEEQLRAPHVQGWFFLASPAPHAVFPSLSSGPRCSASWPLWTRRNFSVRARLGLLVFDDVPRAVLLLVVSGSRCPSSWPAWTTGQLCGGSQVQFLDEVVVPVMCNDICPGPAAHSGGAAGAAHHRGFLMLSPYSTLSLVRQRIHVLHLSTELLKGRRIQRYAWFNSGYKFMRQTAEAGFYWLRCTSRCVPSLFSGPRCLSSRPVWTRRNVMCRRAENCGFSAVAVPRRSCSSSCRCAVAVSHGPDSVGPRDSPVA